MILWLLACNPDDPVEPSFDGPWGSAVLDAADNSIFDEPVGFVANTRNGRIVPLDLKHATLLSDQPAAAFLRPRWVATGEDRMLGDLAVWSPLPRQVTLFAVDNEHDVLVEAPYITGFDNGPIVVEATASAATFIDADNSGDPMSMTGIDVRNGFTTTEDWTIAWSADTWWVTGSRSGKQEHRPTTGQAYSTDNRELSFTLEGTPTDGDRFEIRTETEIVEHDFGAQILHMTHLEDSATLVLALWDGTNDQGAIGVFDLQSRTETGRIVLPKGAQPWRVHPADGDEGELWVADAQLGQVYRITLDVKDPKTSGLQSYDVGGPVADLAHIRDADFNHLFIAPVGTNHLELLDLDTDAWVDINPLDPTTTGLDLRSPVVGMRTAPLPVLLPQQTQWGAQTEDRVVAITLFDGSIIMAQGHNGCLVPDFIGPYGALDDDAAFLPQGPESNPTVVVDDATTYAINVNQCAGVARSETWTATYDQLQGGWVVEGEVSGLQTNTSREDERYISDRGEIQFAILSGSLPSTDGDRLTFQTVEGVLRIAELDAGGSSTPLELPAPPVIFEYDVGATGGGWDEVDLRTYALVPIMNSDLALRVRLGLSDPEVIWD